MPAAQPETYIVWTENVRRPRGQELHHSAAGGIKVVNTAIVAIKDLRLMFVDCLCHDHMKGCHSLTLFVRMEEFHCLTSTVSLQDIDLELPGIDL